MSALGQLTATVSAPAIDYAGIAPIFALAGGAILALLVGLFKSLKAQRIGVPSVTLLAMAVAGDLTIRLWDSNRSIFEGALKVDDLALAMSLIFLVAGACAVLLSLRHVAVRASGSGEYHALLLSSLVGMSVLAAAQNMVTFFIGLELLSIPLYVLCGSHLRRRGSLEAGLKYLIIGSVGSATLAYGLSFIYGATGSTDFNAVARAFGGFSTLLGDPLLLVGVGLAMTGLAFKASVAPFHQWTPDVYQGAPTPVTAFMAVATKAAALAALARFFDQALPSAQGDWGDALAVLAVISILVGNIGAINQESLKRMLGYSGVAQAGYMLAGIVVATRLGLQSLAFYLIVYLFMNLAAFAVVLARERETELGDDIRALEGIGRSRPLLAAAMTVAMLSLAGFPATAGFVGKFYLIRATVEGGYTWLGVAIVVGTMISLVYYLRVVATMWLEERDVVTGEREGGAMPAIAGGSPEADGERPPGPASPASLESRPDFERGHARPHNAEIVAPALVFAAATVVFGILPQPLVQVAEHVGRSIAGLP